MTATTYSHGQPTHWNGKRWVYDNTELEALNDDLCPCSKCGLHAVVVPLPDYIDTSKEVRTVCIDECIVEHIIDLWANGYETLSCCCGHGKRRSIIVLGHGHTDEDVEKIRDLLRLHDSRPWELLQWRIQEVGNDAEEGTTKVISP